MNIFEIHFNFVHSLDLKNYYFIRDLFHFKLLMFHTKIIYFKKIIGKIINHFRKRSMISQTK